VTGQCWETRKRSIWWKRTIKKIIIDVRKVKKEYQKGEYGLPGGR